MPGRPPWSQSGTRGSGQIIASTDRPEIETSKVTPSGDLAAGSSETTEIYAPTNAIYRLQSWRFQVEPIGAATTGTHKYFLRPAGSGAFTAFIASSSFDNQVNVNPTIRSADKKKVPNSAHAQLQSLDDSIATENNPIQITYKNGTDAAQNSDRNVRLVLRRDDY